MLSECKCCPDVLDQICQASAIKLWFSGVWTNGAGPIRERLRFLSAACGQAGARDAAMQL
jgi:hypothetical protein